MCLGERCMRTSDPGNGRHVTESAIKAAIACRWTTRRGARPSAAGLTYGPLGSVGAAPARGARRCRAPGRQIYALEDGGVSPVCRSP